MKKFPLIVMLLATFLAGLKSQDASAQAAVRQGSEVPASSNVTIKVDKDGETIFIDGVLQEVATEKKPSSDTLIERQLKELGHALEEGAGQPIPVALAANRLAEIQRMKSELKQAMNKISLQERRIEEANELLQKDSQAIRYQIEVADAMLQKDGVKPAAIRFFNHSAKGKQSVEVSAKTLRVGFPLSKDVLGTQFDADIAKRQAQLGAIKKKVAKMEETIQQRQKNKDKIVDLRFQVLQNNAKGLDWADQQRPGSQNLIKEVRVKSLPFPVK